MFGSLSRWELEDKFGPMGKGIWFGAHINEVFANRLLDEKVLIDSGANELAR